MKGVFHEVLDVNFGPLLRQRVLLQCSRVLRDQPHLCSAGRRREVGGADVIEATFGKEGCSVGGRDVAALLNRLQKEAPRAHA